MKFLALSILTLGLGLSAHAKDVHIGVASNFSEVSPGSSNPYGAYFKNGLVLAFAQLKPLLKQKGINIVLDEFDYGTSDFKVLETVRKAEKSPVLAMVGYSYSSNALLAAPLHQKFSLPMITPSATANRLGQFGRYIHMGSFSNRFMCEALATLAFKKLKLQKVVAVPAANCAYCSDFASTFSSSFTGLGGKIVATLPVLQEETNFEALISRLKGIEFDAVVVPNQELTSARIISALTKAGVKKVFLGADGWGNVGDEFFEVLKNVSFEGYSISHWHRDMTSRSSREFVQAYRSKYGRDPNDTAVLAYDSGTLLARALVSATVLNREGVENSINRIKSFDGVTGHFEFEPNKAPKKSQVLLRVSGHEFKFAELISPYGTGQK